MTSQTVHKLFLPVYKRWESFLKSFLHIKKKKPVDRKLTTKEFHTFTVTVLLVFPNNTQNIY